MAVLTNVQPVVDKLVASRAAAISFRAVAFMGNILPGTVIVKAFLIPLIVTATLSAIPMTDLSRKARKRENDNAAAASRPAAKVGVS